MALDFFKGSDFAVDDYKRMFIHPAAECTLAVAGGNQTGGNIFEIFDNDTSTLFWYGYTGGGAGQDRTYTITLDFLRKGRAKVIWAYFGMTNNASCGPYGTVTLQASTDGTNWTDLDSLYCPFGATTTKTYSGSDKKFRYLRFSTRAQSTAGAGTPSWKTNIYEVWVTIAE